MLTVSVKNSAPSSVPDERAAPAGERRAAEHRRGDAGQRVGRADRRVADADLGGEEEAGDGSHQRRRADRRGLHEVGATPFRLAASSRNPTASSRSPLRVRWSQTSPTIASAEDHEERQRAGADRVCRNSVKSGLIRPPGDGRREREPCSTLSIAIVVITGLTPTKRTIQPLTKPTASPASRQPARRAPAATVPYRRRR